MPYPTWQYYPRSARSPGWVASLHDAFLEARSDIATDTQRNPSVAGADDVLERIRPAIEASDPAWQVEGKGQTLYHPVFFGENGAEGAGAGLRFQVDGFKSDEGVVLEVMAGGAVQNNGIYKALLEGALIADAAYIALCVPIKYAGGGRPYDKARAILDAVYESERFTLPCEIRGVLVLGF
jgi:hypothetical protein